MNQMKKRLLAAMTIFAILALLFSPAAIEAIPSSSTGPGGVQPPWYGQFRFRREISVVNSGPVELLNYPVLAQVTFGYAHLLSARVELRLVDQAGGDFDLDPPIVDRKAGLFVYKDLKAGK